MRYSVLLFFLLFSFVTTNAFALLSNPFSRLTLADHPLKSYSPEQLTMVGSITQEDAVLGIVKTPTNDVYTVKPGSQIGNNAYVVNVTTKAITIQQDAQMIELVLRHVK